MSMRSVKSFTPLVLAWAVIAIAPPASSQQPPPGAAAPGAPAAANYIGKNERLPTDDLATGRRRFEAGAHTAWHVHPAGQLLHIEDGVGLVQRRGEPVKVLRKGATDFTPAGVPHWHGGAPDTHAVMAMVHFGGIGPWLEPVTDAEYAEKTKHLPGAASRPQQPRPPATAPAATSASQNYFGVTSTAPSSDMTVARGRFEAGARTNWHIHPRGQIILAEEGPVFIQRRGEPIKMLRTGESDFTPPGVAHWHGAAPDTHAKKVVVGFGAATNWLEPVPDAEYTALTKPKRQ
jgi:quercetin dioxygenase-like cupin family protein